MSLFENLNSIYSIKNDIKSVLEDKGIDMTSYSFPDYPSVISSLSGGGGYTQQAITERSYNVEDVSNNATFVSAYAFYSCFVRIVDLPYCGKVYEGAFELCRQLEEVRLPSVTTIGDSAFKSTGIVHLNLPTCIYLENNAFDTCQGLVDVNLPACETISNSVFFNDIFLSSISLPVCQSIGQYVFCYCSRLTSLSLPVCSFIGEHTFAYTNISVLTLGYSSVVSAINCWLPTSTVTAIYVPASLVDVYKSDFYWQNFSSVIFPISE